MSLGSVRVPGSGKLVDDWNMSLRISSDGTCRKGSAVSAESRAKQEDNLECVAHAGPSLVDARHSS